MMMWLHDNTLPDWCHLCGKRQHLLVDVWYPENAEHDDRKRRDHYVRICTSCVDAMAAVIADGRVVTS